MKLEFPGAQLSGNLLVLPSRVRTFDEDAKNFDFPLKRSLKLKEVMGFDRRRTVDDKTCVSDLVVHGFRHLFAEGLVDPDTVDALILVTQTPDHFVPFTSAIIHGRLGLKQDMILLDISQGCAGFVIGAMEALAWLRHPEIRRVAVVTADVLSRRVSLRDRNSLPIIGDGAAITLFDRLANAALWTADIRFDGSRADALKVPAGAFRQPSSPETAELKAAGDNNWRGDDHLCMDGTAVFNFVMTEVPSLIGSLLEARGVAPQDVDHFFVHQPNRFMVRKLAEKLGVDYDKMPDWIVGKYGNSNSVTIPAAIADALPVRLDKPYLACFSGFGVGLTWGALLGEVGPMEFNLICEYPVVSDQP